MHKKYRIGQTKPAPKCPCKLEDKSLCKEKLVKAFGKEVWVIECPYFDRVNRESMAMLNKVFGKMNIGGNKRNK